jgi:hypothetical protein
MREPTNVRRACPRLALTIRSGHTKDNIPPPNISVKPMPQAQHRRRKLPILTAAAALFLGCLQLAHAQLAGDAPMLSYLEGLRRDTASATKFKELTSTFTLDATTPQPDVVYNIFLGTPSIPVTFGRLELKDGRYTIGSSLTLGVGYSFVLGKALYKPGTSVQIEPHLLGGVALDVGARTEAGEVDLAVGGSVYVGISRVAISVGGDLVNKTFVIGLATRVDSFTIAENSYTVFSLWPNP